MDKLLLFPGATEKGIFTYLIDHERSHLVKTASEYNPTIAAYISAAKPLPGKTQILLTALGAGEWWGSNVNGDFFPEAALAHEGENYGYKTFERYAKIYKHHINKDPTASYGDVALSVYNPKYHRVELVVVLDNKKAPDIAQRIEDGDYPEWSMGCRVPYDVCSICGNKAPTRKEYCHHARYYLNKIDPETGKQVYVINTMPKFFDISQVLIGADKTAKTLMKVASSRVFSIAPSSAYIAERMNEGSLAKVAVTAKKATMEKEIPANEPPAGAQALLESIREVKARETPLPRDLLDNLGSRPLPKVLSTLAMLGILPKPQEFQRIVLVSMGRRDVANKLDEQNLCFDPCSCEAPSQSQLSMAGVSPSNFDPSVMTLMLPHMEDRSYSPPHLLKRIHIMIEKNASELPQPTFIKVSEEDARKKVGIVPMLLATAGLYAAMNHSAPAAQMGNIDKLIAKHPGLLAALGFGILTTFNQLAGAKNKGQTFLPSENPDVSNIADRINSLREKPITKLGAGNPVASRLGLMLPVYMGSGVLQKQKDANPYDQEGTLRRFWRRNPDIISAALAVDALASGRGGGTAKLIKQLSPKVDKLKSSLSGLLKKAEGNLLSDAVVWPLAFGRSGLPGRVAGGLIDQAIVGASKKLLSTKENPNKLETTRRKV